MTDKIISFAKKVHANDKYGSKPYWTHLDDVASKVDSDLNAIAWSHDIIEDHPDQLPQLRHLLSQRDLFQVMILTRRPDETYMEYIRRIKSSKSIIARKIKIADIQSNLDAKPLASLRKRYLTALELLERP